MDHSRVAVVFLGGLIEAESQFIGSATARGDAGEDFRVGSLSDDVEGVAVRWDIHDFR
jgi:hypothetical protein